MDASPFSLELPGICDLQSKILPIGDVKDLLASRLGEALGFQWKTNTVSSWSNERLSEILAERFRSESWNFRR